MRGSRCSIACSRRTTWTHRVPEVMAGEGERAEDSTADGDAVHEGSTRQHSSTLGTCGLLLNVARSTDGITAAIEARRWLYEHHYVVCDRSDDPKTRPQLDRTAKSCGDSKCGDEVEKRTRGA